MTPAAKHWQLYVSITGITLAVSCVIGELMLRYIEQSKLAAEVREYTSKGYQFEAYRLIYSDERDTEYKFGHKANANVKLTRGYYEFTFQSNAAGLRETKDYAEISGGSVIFLGDSVVEGASVENNETMDSVFEQLTGIAALNFGVASRGVYLAHEFAKAKYLVGYNTKLIFFGFCLNDFEEATYVRYFDERTGNWGFLRALYPSIDGDGGLLYRIEAMPGGRFIGWVLNRALESRLIQLLSGARAAATVTTASRPVKPWSSQSVTPAQFAFTEAQLRRLKALTNSLGSELVVVVFPAREQFGVSYEAGERIQDSLVQILERNGIEYLDLHQPMKDAMRADPESQWFHDYVHPSSRGHRFIGEYLATWVGENRQRLFK